MDPLVVSYVVATVVSLSVGVPILARGWRYRDPAVALLGAAVTFDGLEWLAWALCIFTPAYGTPLGDSLGIFSRVGISASAVCVIAFTRFTFRRDSGAALAASWLLVAALAIGFFGSGAIAGDWIGERSDYAWIWVEQVAQIIGYVWATVELCLCYLKMRRRRAHGLADPLITNRVLLWGIWAGLFALSQILYAVTLALFGPISGLDQLNAVLVVSAEIALWFTVFAPEWYTRWITATADGTS
jgi:hypothetical protein